MAAKKTKLIIDGQIFQTAAKDRGMGRYSVCLIQELLKQKDEFSEIEIILTKNLPTESIGLEELQKTFAGAGTQILDLLTTANHKIEVAFRHNEDVLKNYVRTQQHNGFIVYYLVPALFQEPTVAVFPPNAWKLLLFYDLIPYLYHKNYEPTIKFEDYLKRFKYIYQAEQIFTISKTVADDLMVYLGIPTDRITVIDGAAIRADCAPAAPSSPVPDNFILMPTSDDLRKNNLRTVIGFEEFRSINNTDHKLIITSKINSREREHLSLFSKHLIFTGSLPEEQLDWLYEKCQAVLFVPEYEGLGLPILEAVERGKNVVCSSIGVFKEISDNAFCFCDHENPSSIAQALETALQKKPAAAQYKKIAAHYTWPKTARRLTDAVKNFRPRPNTPKPKIAIFCPSPDGFSAIGKVVAESHAVMSEYFDIDYYLEAGLHVANARPNYLKYLAPTHSAKSFGVQAYRDYDAVIYHIGNGDYHLDSIKNALYLPGYVILHDTFLKDAFRVLGQTNMMPAGRIELEEKLNSNSPNSPVDLTSLVGRQLGALTHSKYAAGAAKADLENTIPANLPTSVPKLPSIRQPNQTVIGLAGILADIKGLQVIEDVARDPAFSGCQIWLFGFSHATKATIDRLNSYENVSVTTSLTDFEFQTNLSKLNVFVNYRMDYHGETSLSTIEAMRYGVTVMVRNIGWYGELPDDVVVKVDSQEGAIGQLRSLVQNPQKLADIGARAKQHIFQNFNHEQYALHLKSLIGQSQNINDLNNKLAVALKEGRLKSKQQYIQFLQDNM